MAMAAAAKLAHKRVLAILEGFSGAFEDLIVNSVQNVQLLSWTFEKIL
jgi:hypothetical protein